MLDYRGWKRRLAGALLLSASVLQVAGGRGSIESIDDEFANAWKLNRSEQFDVALPKTEEGLRRAERAGNALLVWRFRLLKVEILRGQRKTRASLSALDSYGEPPAGAEWAEIRTRAFLDRGFALYLLHRYAEARDALSRAAEAANSAGLPSLSLEVELRRGAVLAKGPHPEEARPVLDSVIEASARMHDTYLEATAALNIGRLLQSELRYEEAIPWSQRAASLYRDWDARESIARATENIGYSYFRLGDYDNARLNYGQAQGVFTKTGNQDELQLIIGNIGNISYEAGDYKSAEAAYAKGLEIARLQNDTVRIADWLGNLATTSIELEDWDRAEQYNREALDRTRELEDRRSEPNLLINAARIEAQRDMGKAETLFRSALMGRSQDPSVPLDAHAGLAHLYIRRGLPDLAEDEFHSTVAEIDQGASSLLDDEEKIKYAASLNHFYGMYVDFLIANGKSARALEIAESSRSRVLAERTSRTEPAQPDKAEDYQRLARETGSVLLEYWLGSKESYLWVITPERIQYHVLPAQGEIYALMENYRAVTMQHRNPLESAAETGQQLYTALLAPVEHDAPNAARFIIVSDGGLHNFNFETLPAGRDNGKFWIEQAAVAISPSLSYLASHRRTGNTHPDAGPRKPLLLIGDPAPANAEYPRLEYAGREIDSIASAMGGSEQLRGSEARPESYAKVQPARFGFIHFAAHAVANPVNPLDSAIILSGTPETFRLSARDVLKSPLTAEIVTISACRSAGAKAYAGEGLVGFAWAFLKAGAENVVAGLWDVNDRSTEQLMTGLYERIAGGATAADALRESKLALIRGGGAYARPFYWAPFELYTGAYR